eukprot:scaffold137970_cov15-Tisochrysis_lutea.AAC.1
MPAKSPHALRKGPVRGVLSNTLHATNTNHTQGEHSTQSFNIQQPAKPVISLEELAAVAARLAASCASTPVGLAKLEQDVLSHFDAAPHFLALGAGCTSLLDMMHKCPHFAEVLNATWGTSDVRPGAVARKDVSKDQLLRATAQAAAAYRATHSVAQQQLGGPGSVNDEEVLYVEQALRVQVGEGHWCPTRFSNKILSFVSCPDVGVTLSFFMDMFAGQ